MIDAHREAALIKMDNQHTKLGPGMPVCPLPSSCAATLPAPPPYLHRHLYLRRYPYLRRYYAATL